MIKSIESEKTKSSKKILNELIECLLPKQFTPKEKEPIISAIMYKLNLIEWKDE